MGWRAPVADDPFAPAAPEPPRLLVVERERRGLLSQLGAGWVIALAALAVGAVLVAAFVWQPMMTLR